MAREYIIYCDESEEKGRHFSNFYGGALIQSEHIDEVRNALAAKKRELRFNGEVKWNKITKNYEEKYKELINCFFDLVEQGKIKTRVMFTQNTHEAINLTKRHIEEKYFILYYEFIKHAFGLVFSPQIPGGVNLRVYPDKLPDTAEQTEKFKSYIESLKQNQAFRRLDIRIRKEDIAEVTSHDHDILQCIDIVLGSIHFRLNDKHLVKPDGARIRGNRTRAKEAVYNAINKRIRKIYPNFNIGITTGHQGSTTNRWAHPYRHWLFSPTEKVIRPGSKRRSKAETP